MQKEVGVCMTVRGEPPELLLDWVRWHLQAMQFAQAFIVFDDPGELSPSIFPDGLLRQLTLIPASAVPLSTCPSYRKYFISYPAEVMSRQILHAEHCARLAREAGCSWLLHLDSDELWYHPSLTAPALFSTVLPIDAVVTFRNAEMVHTEATALSRNRFREVTLFRKPGSSGFKAYTNGKSAVNLRLQTPAIALGVHGWVNVPFEIFHSSAVILHYVSSSYAAWKRKYELLGNFGDKWFGVLPITVSSHLASRDADKTLEAYRKIFCESEETLQKLSRSGSTVTILEPSLYLSPPTSTE
eukprot:gnl/Hemi2/15220_TR5137_c0_g6_i1.p1 gnl/Hemi2/15220_TR5137_c0_g6~~gnl/Hemi2/15220_TR5137_c0_g6_i1.p1  ORF type:complete len:299 (-),score=37.63 gnl/Hemi2/15220_TR5137_c0_g6_i1:38-934(-)